MLNKLLLLIETTGECWCKILAVVRQYMYAQFVENFVFGNQLRRSCR